MSRATLFGAVLAILPVSARTAPRVGQPLPLSEVPAKAPGDWLAFFMTGDGGYVSADRQLTAQLADSGIGVVVLNSRAYLDRRPTPDEASEDVARTIQDYMDRWSRTRIVLIGSSRGADLLPFITSRFPPELRDRVGLLVLFGLNRWASFEFHLIDLFMDRHRATDLPVPPELERLRGTRVLCLYGDHDDASYCPDADTSLIVPIVAGSGHRLRGETASQLAALILHELPDSGK